MADEFDPHEALCIIRRIGSAFHAYTCKHDRDFTKADPDEDLCRGDLNQEYLSRLQTLQTLWVRAAERIGHRPFEARRVFGDIKLALFKVRREFFRIKKYWHNWRDDPYRKDGFVSTLAGQLGLPLTASEEEVKEAAEKHNAHIRDGVQRLIDGVIAAAGPFANDIQLTLPLIESPNLRTSLAPLSKTSLGLAVDVPAIEAIQGVGDAFVVCGKRMRLRSKKAGDGVRVMLANYPGTVNLATLGHTARRYIAQLDEPEWQAAIKFGGGAWEGYRIRSAAEADVELVQMAQEGKKRV